MLFFGNDCWLKYSYDCVLEDLVVFVGMTSFLLTDSLDVVVYLIDLEFPSFCDIILMIYILFFIK